MSSTIIQKKRTKESREMQEAKTTDPRRNMEGFDVAETIREIESAVSDSSAFYTRMESNENVRKCKWPGKHSSGRKRDSKESLAKPWNGAADHEVHLAQKVLLQLTALCSASMVRGSLNVTPMEGTDARAAAQMKNVMRYYLETVMRGERLIHATRWASWARRYGHAVLYVGWKTLKSMEKREVRESEIVAAVEAQLMQGAQSAMQDAGMDPEGQQEAAMILTEQIQQQAMDRVQSMTPEELTTLVLALKPELQSRGKQAQSEARKAVDELRADTVNADRMGTYYSAFLKENRPVWEALRPGIDFLCPPETLHEETFDSARWLYRLRWLSVQQVREEAAVREWDPQWVLEVTTKHRGRAKMFCGLQRSWALGGIAVGRDISNRDSVKHLVQIGELYERRTTADGVQCLYKTVLHPDVVSRVAKRELLEDWHGHYPFVTTTSEQDEPFLLDNRGVPEIVKSAQEAIKTQVDSRDDMASLTTLPPWTGPENLQGTVIAPGAFIPEWRTGAVTAFKLPPPDGRSIEIENTLRAEVDNYFGLISKSVPDALTQLLGQVGTDWFLMSYSRAVALTAQLVQQRMSPLIGARITGTQIVFDATREGVRGNFDFHVKFDVKSLDLDWFKEVLAFAKDAMAAFDPRQLTDKRVFLEMAYNMIDPALADRAIQTEDSARDSELAAIREILNAIFSGDAAPHFPMGVDFQTRADEMVQNLQSSPVRQNIMRTVPEVAAVWEDYLQKLYHQMDQQGANKQAGIVGGSDPLRQSPLARLKSGGWEAATGMQPEQMAA